MRSAESDGGLVTRFDGRFRVLVLMAADAVCLFSVWTFTVWAYRALGPGHYKYGAEFYLRLWPVVLVYIALNAMFRLYHGSVMHPAAPVTPPEELRRLVGSSLLTHLGLIAYLALAYQTTEHYSRAVIVISGCLAAFLAHAWLRARGAEVDRRLAAIERSQKTAEILGARHALPKGAVLKREDVAPMRTLAAVTSDDNIPADQAVLVLGRPLLHAVSAEDPILWSYIDGGRDASRGLADSIQARMRAVSIPVSGAAAVSGLVRPNDHVDVLGSFALPAEGAAAGGAEPELVTLTVLQNATVLATGTETARSGSRREGAGYGTVTLLVSPREAEVLVFAQQMKGRLFLTLRNPSDLHFEEKLPRVDFRKIEEELEGLNAERQKRLGAASRATAR